MLRCEHLPPSESNLFQLRYLLNFFWTRQEPQKDDDWLRMKKGLLLPVLHPKQLLQLPQQLPEQLLQLHHFLDVLLIPAINF
jgi:hypothetical protein